MKTPTSQEVKIAAASVHVHQRTMERVDGIAELVRTDPTIRALIDALLHHAGPGGLNMDQPRGALIDAAFLTGLELGLHVGRGRQKAEP